jgi:pimeloyl-ACP methyl ester carboxylesterase
MKKIYCISGLGADERAFARLQIDGYSLVVLPWLMPTPNETIEQYAGKMSESITDKDPIIMGLSFGGMMCVEIAKLIPVQKVILISSIKSVNELPAWLKYSGKLKLNKIFPMRSFSVLEPIQNFFLGAIGKDEKDIARSYRKNAPQPYVDWAINEVLHWRNTFQPPALHHIHGDNDKMFPIRYVSPTHIIKGGGHFMIMNKAEEVSAIISKIV